MGEQQGFDLQVRSSWGGGTLHSALVGRFNAANLLGVLGVAGLFILAISCDIVVTAAK